MFWEGKNSSGAHRIIWERVNKGVVVFVDNVLAMATV